MTPLADWMAENGIDDDALAAALTIDRSTASRIRRGKLLPSSSLIARIVHLTDGAVPASSFFAAPYPQPEIEAA